MAPSSSRDERGTPGAAIACAAHFLIGVDGLAVAIALPALQRDLGAAPIDGQWVLTAYGVAFGGCLLLGGRLGDLYGRRRALTWGLGLFAAGAVIAGLAPVLGVLIAGRVLQGLGAAASIPAALALIGSLFPPGPRRTRALSLLAAMASVGTMSGLVLGGAITGALGWRWVFLIIAPLALAAALAGRRVLPEARADGPALRLDVAGAALATGGLATILFALTRIEHGGVGHVPVLGPLLAGCALLGAFAARERRAGTPLLRPAVLRIRSLQAASLGGAANSVAFTAIVYVGTFYLQLALGFGPLQAGLALVPLDAVAFVVPLAAARMIAGRAPGTLLAGATVCTALSLLWLARAPVPADYVADVLGPLVVMGASLSVAFVVLTHQAVADVAPDDRGAASGIFETCNHLFGGAVGVAIYATVLTAAGEYRAAFLAAVALALLGLPAAWHSRG
jgi:MFS family permease